MSLPAPNSLFPLPLYKHVGSVGATRFQSVSRPRHSGRAAPWARADPLHGGSLGPRQSRPQT
eukprot:15286001-Alexandrium_andersonii.AAC.1